MVQSPPKEDDLPTEEVFKETNDCVVPVEEGLEQPPKLQKPKKPQEFPWKGGLIDKLRKLALTRTFQAAIQLCLGSLLVQLFTYNGRMRFTQACLATVFFVAGMLLVAPDAHVGGRLVAGAMIVGPTWVGALVCVCVISLARAPGVAYTTFLIVFLAIGLVLLTTLRVKGSLGTGIVSNLGFGITLVSGQFIWGAKRLWHDILLRTVKIGLLGCLGIVASGLFVLPTLAGDDLRLTLAEVLKDLGLVVSEAAGHLLLRAEDEYRVEEGVGTKEESVKRGKKARMRTLEELRMLGDETDSENLDRLSNPQQDLRPKWMTDKRALSLADIRPRLQSCRALFTNASVEPGFLRFGISKINISRWPPVLNAVETLVMRIAALDSLIEGEHPLMLDSEIIKSVGSSVLPAYRLLFAHVAAALSTASRSVKAEVQEKANGGEPLLTQPAWALLESELAAAMYTGLKEYWKHMRQKADAGLDFILPPPELRAALYMGTIGSAILEAMVNLENALQSALVTSPQTPEEKLTRPVKNALSKLASASANLLKTPAEDIPACQNIAIDMEMSKPLSAKQLQISNAKEEGQPISPRYDMRISNVSFTTSLTSRPLQSKSTEEMLRGLGKDDSSKSLRSPKKGNKSQGPDSGLWTRVTQTFGWAIPLVKVLCAWDVVMIFKELFVKDIPQAFSSKKNLSNTIWRNRWFQFGIKFYVASTLVLSLLMAIQEDHPWSREWNGLYINMTVVVVLSEKVDTTIQKGITRILTTCLGAVVGFVVMLNTRVATNSYALAAIVCFLSFVSGLFSLMPSLKYALFLFLITLDSMILCQYNGKTHGQIKNFYTRLVVTVWGVLLCIIFDLLMPWYASSAALETLGGAVKASGEILFNFSEIWEEEVQTAAGEEEMQHAKAGIMRMELNQIQQQLAGPLAGVQASVAREGVLWKQGLLALPPIVGQLMELLQEVLEKLAALELMLLQKPIISGRFTGTTWRVFQQDMRGEMKMMRDKGIEVCNACSAVLGEYPTAKDMECLKLAIDKLKESRVTFREEQRERLQLYHRLVVKGTDPLIEGRTTDDGIRYQSVIFAFAKSFDKIAKLARTLADDPWLQLRCQHPHAWHTWRTWTGNYGYK